MAVIDRLDREKVSAHYDVDTAIAYITYRGELSAAESDAAYQWLQKVIDTIGAETLYGEVFDFREVKFFTVENLIGARKNSRRMNIMLNTHDFPVALVVANQMQQEILRGPMRVVPQNKRKRIVNTMEAALAFFKEWHEGDT